MYHTTDSLIGGIMDKPCGCKIVCYDKEIKFLATEKIPIPIPATLSIKFCELHASAGEMLEALAIIVKNVNLYKTPLGTAETNNIYELISRAEGKPCQCTGDGEHCLRCYPEGKETR